MDESRRLAMRRAHARRASFCTCGKIVHGNGARAAHEAVHARKGDGHHYLVEDEYRRRQAISAGEGQEIADAPMAEPATVDFEQRRDGWLVAFIPISSAARQWSIDAAPQHARWEHERWYAKRDMAVTMRHELEAEGFTVREV